MFRFLGVSLVCLALGACGALPRGAGLQSEVIGMSDTDDDTLEEIIEQDFAVEDVTREKLATYIGWPAVGESSLNWINRVDQPNTRIIRAGDTVKITIWDTDPNSLLTAPSERFVTLPDMRVSSGGSVFLPYVGSLKISGMSPETARSRIEEQ